VHFRYRRRTLNAVTTFGGELRRLREMRELTQKQVSGQLTGSRSGGPLAQGVYSTWETNQATPTKEQLAALASALDVDIGDLIAIYPASPEPHPAQRKRKAKADLAVLDDPEFLAEMQRGFHRTLLRALDRDRHDSSWIEAMAEAARLWGVPWRDRFE